MSLLRPLMHAQQSRTKRVVKFKGALLSNLAFNFRSCSWNLCKEVSQALTCNIRSEHVTESIQLMQQLVIFLTASVDVLLRGDATNSTTFFGGATTNNFAS